MDELENDSLTLLLILDDNLFPQFLEWTNTAKLTNLVMFLLEADYLRFKCNKKFQLIQEKINIHQACNFLKNGPSTAIERVISHERYQACERLIRSRIPMHASLSHLCDLVWHDLLLQGRKITQSPYWNTMKKNLLDCAEIDKEEILQDLNYRKYFERYLQINPNDLACLQCWITTKKILMEVKLFHRQKKINPYDSLPPDGSPMPSNRSSSGLSTPSSTTSDRKTSFFARLRMTSNLLGSNSSMLSQAGTLLTPGKSGGNDNPSASPLPSSSNASANGPSTPNASLSANKVVCNNYDYIDPFEALKVLLNGARSLQRQFFPSNNHSTQKNFRFNSFQTISTSSPISSPTLTCCSGLSEPLRMELAATLALNASIRTEDIETVDNNFAIACSNILENLLQTVEMETFQYIQSKLDSFMTSNDYAFMMSTIKCQTSPKVVLYAQKLDFLYNIAQQEQLIHWADSRSRGTLFLANDRKQENQDYQDTEEENPHRYEKTIDELDEEYNRDDNFKAPDWVTEEPGLVTIKLELNVPEHLNLTAENIDQLPQHLSIWASKTQLTLPRAIKQIINMASNQQPGIIIPGRPPAFPDRRVIGRVTSTEEDDDLGLTLQAASSDSDTDYSGDGIVYQYTAESLDENDINRRSNFTINPSAGSSKQRSNISPVDSIGSSSDSFGIPESHSISSMIQDIPSSQIPSGGIIGSDADKELFKFQKQLPNRIDKKLIALNPQYIQDEFLRSWAMLLQGKEPSYQQFNLNSSCQSFLYTPSSDEADMLFSPNSALSPSQAPDISPISPMLFNSLNQASPFTSVANPTPFPLILYHLLADRLQIPISHEVEIHEDQTYSLILQSSELYCLHHMLFRYSKDSKLTQLITEETSFQCVVSFKSIPISSGLPTLTPRTAPRPYSQVTITLAFIPITTISKTWLTLLREVTYMIRDFPSALNPSFNSQEQPPHEFIVKDNYLKFYGNLIPKYFSLFQHHLWKNDAKKINLYDIYLQSLPALLASPYHNEANIPNNEGKDAHPYQTLTLDQIEKSHQVILTSYPLIKQFGICDFAILSLVYNISLRILIQILMLMLVNSPKIIVTSSSTWTLNKLQYLLPRLLWPFQANPWYDLELIQTEKQFLNIFHLRKRVIKEEENVTQGITMRKPLLAGSFFVKRTNSLTNRKPFAMPSMNRSQSHRDPQEADQLMISPTRSLSKIHHSYRSLTSSAQPSFISVSSSELHSDMEAPEPDQAPKPRSTSHSNASQTSSIPETTSKKNKVYFLDGKLFHTMRLDALNGHLIPYSANHLPTAWEDFPDSEYLIFDLDSQTKLPYFLSKPSNQPEATPNSVPNVNNSGNMDDSYLDEPFLDLQSSSLFQKASFPAYRQLIQSIHQHTNDYFTKIRLLEDQRHQLSQLPPSAANPSLGIDSITDQIYEWTIYYNSLTEICFHRYWLDLIVGSIPRVISYYQEARVLSLDIQALYADLLIKHEQVLNGHLLEEYLKKYQYKLMQNTMHEGDKHGSIPFSLLHSLSTSSSAKSMSSQVRNQLYYQLICSMEFEDFLTFYNDLTATSSSSSLSLTFYADFLAGLSPLFLQLLHTHSEILLHQRF